MKNHNFGNSGFIAQKLNISKAYDWVKWSFLKDVVLQMGFNEKWVALVMECITNVTYSLLMNGEPKELLHPLEVSAKGTLSPHTSSSCTQRDFIDSFNQKLVVET